MFNWFKERKLPCREMLSNKERCGKKEKKLDGAAENVRREKERSEVRRDRGSRTPEVSVYALKSSRRGGGGVSL
jgi:hypothetical protein